MTPPPGSTTRDDTPHAWLTPERLKLYPVAFLAALTVAMAVTALTADGTASLGGRLGGDLPAFFGAGRLLLEGRAAELYDWSAQRDAQAGLHLPGEDGQFLAFAYPPFVAIPYALLVPLGFTAAWVIHSLIMAALLLLAVHVLRPVLPRLDRYPVAAYAGALALVPLFRAVTGGQNTAVTIALVALAWRAWHDRRYALAGVPLGLLLFKPQLGLPLIGLFLLRRRLAVLPTLAGTAAALWVAGALVAGTGWVGWWWAQATHFRGIDQSINAPNAVGLLGVAEALLGQGSPLALWLALPAVTALVLWLVVRWWRGHDPLWRRMAFTAPAVALVPPHAMHYDGGLAVLALWVIGDRLGRRALGVMALLYAAAALAVTRGLLGVNPMAGVIAATVVLAARLPAGREPPDPPRPVDPSRAPG
jgi:hypothetical protein